MHSPAPGTDDGLPAPRPPLLWRLAVLSGVGTMAVLATNDEAWAAWEEATGGRLPRRAVRALLVATGVAHVLEAVVTHRRATALRLANRGRWVRSTLVFGFPALVQLGRLAHRAGGD